MELLDTSVKVRDVRAIYWFFDIVYLRVRSEKLTGMITGIALKPTGLTYAVTWGTGTETWHYEMELTSEYVPDFSP